MSIFTCHTRSIRAISTLNKLQRSPYTDEIDVLRQEHFSVQCTCLLYKGCIVKKPSTCARLSMVMDVHVSVAQQSLILDMDKLIPPHCTAELRILRVRIAVANLVLGTLRGLCNKSVYSIVYLWRLAQSTFLSWSLF